MGDNFDKVKMLIKASVLCNIILSQMEMFGIIFT